MTPMLGKRPNRAKAVTCATLAFGMIVTCFAPANAQFLPFGVILGGGGGSAIGAAVAGAAVGSMIAAALNEQDRAAVARVTRSAISTGKTRHYRNKHTGVKAKAQVVNSRKIEGRKCRTVKQEVVLKDGSVLSDTVRACMGPNGWQVV
jgi:hypothetical protein